MTDALRDSLYYFGKANEVYSRREYDKAATFFYSARKSSSTSKVYRNIAVNYYMKGDYQKAARKFTISLAMSPYDTIAVNGIACCLLNLGKYEEANKNFKKAVEIDRMETQAHLNWALSLYCLKREMVAEETFNAALESRTLTKKVLVERYELQLSLAKEKLPKVTNEDAKALLEEHISGYHWILERINKLTN